jgi:hypothetical protein
MTADDDDVVGGDPECRGEQLHDRLVGLFLARAVP